MAHPYAGDAVIALKEGEGRGLVEHLDAFAGAARMERLHQLLAAAPDVACQAAPELEFAVDIERLAVEAELKPDTLFAHPAPGLKAAGDEEFGEVGVGAPFGEAADIVVILLGGIGADIDIAELMLADVGDELRQIVEAVIDDAERPAGKGRVAARRLLRRNLQHQHRGAVFLGAERGAGRRVAGADDDDVPLGDFHPALQICPWPGATRPSTSSLSYTGCRIKDVDVRSKSGQRAGGGRVTNARKSDPLQRRRRVRALYGRVEPVGRGDLSRL